jgi:5-methylcytosine-specific restriction endonuclease McrA
MGTGGRVQMLAGSVLVLNLNYVPVNVCNVRRAVVLLGKGKAELLANGRGEIHTPSRAVTIPSVIRLVYLVKRPFSPRKFSRREVFTRDSFTCQYCGKQTRNLTLDHVVPRRQGGRHCWENVVSACIPCNHRKAGRTPHEAGMRLRREPKAPPASPYHILQSRPVQEEWLPFIPWAIQ